MVDNNYNNKCNKDSKNYVARSFVIDKDVMTKLKRMAVEENRSLNWLVRQILKEYCARM